MPYTYSMPRDTKFSVNVVWDAIGEELDDLPKGRFEVVLPAANMKGLTEDYGVGEALVDFISDQYDFCIESIDYKQID